MVWIREVWFGFKKYGLDSRSMAWIRDVWFRHFGFRGSAWIAQAANGVVWKNMVCWEEHGKVVVGMVQLCGEIAFSKKKNVDCTSMASLPGPSGKTSSAYL